MRVRARVLTVVPVLAAMACGIAAAGSADRPMCDLDNGGLNLPGGFCALVVYDAKTLAGGPARVRDIAVAGTGGPTRRRDSARAPATASTSEVRISISHRTIA